MAVRRGRRRAIAVAVAGTALAGWALLPRERLLLDRATKAADARSWNMEPLFGYFWLSDRQALYLDRQPGPSAWHPQVFELPSGRSVPCPGLERVMKTVNYGEDSADVTPDGRLLAIDGSAACTVSDLQGTRSFVWPTRASDDQVWLSDSRHRLDIADPGAGPATQAILRDADAPNLEEKCTFLAGRGPDLENGIRIAGGPAGTLLTVGWPHDGPDMNDHPGHVTVTTWQVGRVITPILERQVRLPAHAQLNDLRFSPRGDRIVWELETPLVNPLAVSIGRLLRSFRIKPQEVDALWISRADGSDMHEVGHIAVVLDSHGQALTGIEAIRWMPDGQRLSFFYHDTLYTVLAR